MNNGDDKRDDNLGLFDSYEESEEEAALNNDSYAEYEGHTTQTKPSTSNIYSSDCKIETEDYRLKNSLVIHFENLSAITGVHPSAGAILISLITSEGELVEVWIPKKLCCNLDKKYKIVSVWDGVMLNKINDIGGLAYEPKYATNPEAYEKNA